MTIGRTEPLVRVQGVTVAYGATIALQDVSLELKGKGLVQVIGPNGAGKTTLFKVIAGVVTPLRGRVYVNGVDVTGKPEVAGRYVSYMPQLPPEIDVPLTPYEALERYIMLYAARWPRIRAKTEVRKRVEEVLSLVGLPRDAWHKPIPSLSGGQRQRAMLARALAVERPVLLLDEPLASIDPAGRAELARLIGEVSRERLVVVTSHDPTLLKPYTRLMVLLNRRVVAVGGVDEVLRVEVLSKVYGAAAIEVAPGHVHIADSHAPTRW